MFSEDLVNRLVIVNQKLQMLEDLMANLGPDLLDIHIRNSILLLIDDLIQESAL
jgi:hypothetical protein